MAKSRKAGSNAVIFGLLILAAGIIGGLFLSRGGSQPTPSGGTLSRASHSYENLESWDFVEREDGTFSIKVHRKADVN